jgi:glucosamine--fructose-6-phosphate aminotransferase (isomerizing)
MCGIFGYVGARSAFPIIFDGLGRLEYRGYDSAGIALLVDGRLKVSRVPGRVEKLRGAANGAGNVGIGHTRWATHGEPCERNAHPHMDCTSSVAVVHNGIIENHKELRDALEARGHTFRSETDTEVIVHLLEEHRERPLTAVLPEVVKQLHGDYAFAVLSEAAPSQIAVARCGGAPLVIGFGEGEYFLASDLLALASHTRQVLPLENHEIALITPDGVEISSTNGHTNGAGRRAPVTIGWRAEDSRHDGHDTYMHKEIHEQPAAIRRTLADRASLQVADVSLGEVPLTDEQWKQLRRVVLIGCGTSYHAGLVGAAYFERLAGIPAAVETASEFRYRSPIVGPGDLCVLISQSGETADTVGAARVARSREAMTIGVCNVPGASLTREAAGVTMTSTGPEIGVASTKAFTAQMVALLLLAIRAGRARGMVAPERALALLRDLAGLPTAIEKTLDDEEHVRALATLARDGRDFFYLGRGLGYPVALEGALKLKEIAYVRAEGFAAGEMKHGPLALIDRDTTTIALALPGVTHPKVVSTIEEVRARGGAVIGVCVRGDEIVPPLVDHTLLLPAVSELLLPCVAVIPLQLFAYHMAMLRGCDVDHPRNLAKSVTVE